MKDKIKNLLKDIILIIVVSSITAYATTNYRANEIVYANQAGVDVTVDQALDDLYYASSNFANPRGTIISVMRNNAPEGYLKCDGTIYKISDYQKLADLFNEEFGKINYFGGDGETTFAVPDLRGEFLRGTGTNSHDKSGSGASVGVHQQATLIPYIRTGGSSGSTNLYFANNGAITHANMDYYEAGSGVRRIDGSTITTTGVDAKLFASRPTNTSVLYCIKY